MHSSTKGVNTLGMSQWNTDTYELTFEPNNSNATNLKEKVSNMLKIFFARKQAKLTVNEVQSLAIQKKPLKSRGHQK